jgi:predicted Na+-dependent transporter
MGLAAEIVSSILLFGLVLGMSATVELQQVQRQLRNRTALLIGLLLQFFLLPFVGFVVVKIFRFPSAVGITLLVVTSSPGGSYSNWWCSLFNASLALSVTMTAISTLLSTIMLPLNLMMYTRWAYSSDVVQSLDWQALFVSIVVVLGGIAAGLVGGRVARHHGRSEIFHRRANLFGNLSGLALVSLSVAVSSTGHQAALWDQDAGFYVGCALPALIGLCVAVRLTTRFDLDKPERVAVAVESCYQNTGIATSVALTMFSGDETQLATAIGVPLYYGIVVAVMLAVFCVVSWKMGWTKAPRNENFCKMLYNSYEVEHDPGVREAEVSIEVVYGGGDEEDGHAGAAVVFEQTDDSSYIVDAASLHKVERDRAASPAASSSQQRRSTASSDEETAECSEASADARRSLDEELAYDDPRDEEPSATAAGLPSPEEVGRFGRTIAVIKARATGYRTPHVRTRPLSTADEDDHDQHTDYRQYHHRHHPSHPVTYDPRILSALDEADDETSEISVSRPSAPSATVQLSAVSPDESVPAPQEPRAPRNDAAPKRPKKSYLAVPMSLSPDDNKFPPPQQPTSIPAEGRTID